MVSPTPLPAADAPPHTGAGAAPAPAFEPQGADFLATLAHELRSPLAPLRNGLLLLRRTQDRAVEERTLDMMDRQVTYLGRLVEDLLDVARLRTGKLVLQREVIDLREVIGHALELSQPQIDLGQHELVLQLPDDPLWVDGDPTRLCQVLSNLLNNAAKFTPRHGHVALRARTEGRQVVVTVSDDGLGMTPQALAQAFEMFSQGTTGTPGGLGIGLALVRALVTMHDGEIVAASDGPDQGSTFTVRLPLTASGRRQPG